MIRLLGRPRRCCDGLTRGETLAAGARPGQAKSVILLYLLGGAATQDMWDLKPDAPAEVRGEFEPIATSAPGVRVSEHLPLTARFRSSPMPRPPTSRTGW